MTTDPQPLTPDKAACARCRTPFDPGDTRYDGHAEERGVPGYCRGCVDRCHEGSITHRCVICSPNGERH